MQRISRTTPYTQATRTWMLGYDGQGCVSGVTSPVSGSVGQAGYTPSYTPGQTVVVQGVGTSGALTTTYTLDGQGQAMAVTDGLGTPPRRATTRIMTSPAAPMSTGTRRAMRINTSERATAWG